MIYWRIQLDDGRTGYQVMDDNLGDTKVVDDNGQPFDGPIQYTTTDTEPAGPFPAVTLNA